MLYEIVKYKWYLSLCLCFLSYSFAMDCPDDSNMRGLGRQLSQVGLAQQSEKSITRTRSLSELAPTPTSTRSSGSGSPTRKTSLPTQEIRKVILVIEDLEMIHRIFSRWFQEFREDFSDYKLIFAPTGEKGVEEYFRYQPGLTFVDFNLTTNGMNGVEVLNAIKGRCDSIGIEMGTFIAFSDNAYADDANDQMIQAGAAFKITKLKNKKLFQEALTKYLPPTM